MEKDLVALSTFLKEGTRATHDNAEGSQFQHKLANAELPLSMYKLYLEQLYLVHDQLEHGLSGSVALAHVATKEQYQAPFLERDLESLGVTVNEIKPMPSTTQMLSNIEDAVRSNPLQLLGYHYVLLGSKHGGKFIATQLHKKFGFENAGCLYFDPYGTTFQPLWAEFKTSMDKVATSESLASSVLQAAKQMFDYVATLGGEVEKADAEASNN